MDVSKNQWRSTGGLTAGTRKSCKNNAANRVLIDLSFYNSILQQKYCAEYVIKSVRNIGSG